MRRKKEKLESYYFTILFIDNDVILQWCKSYNTYNERAHTIYERRLYFYSTAILIFLLFSLYNFAFSHINWYNFHGLISRHSSLEYIKRCCGVHFIDFSNNEENKFMLQTRADKISCYIEINAASIMHELMIAYKSANIKLVEMNKCQHTF